MLGRCSVMCCSDGQMASQWTMKPTDCTGAMLCLTIFRFVKLRKSAKNFINIPRNLFNDKKYEVKT